MHEILSDTQKKHAHHEEGPGKLLREKAQQQTAVLEKSLTQKLTSVTANTKKLPGIIQKLKDAVQQAHAKNKDAHPEETHPLGAPYEKPEEKRIKLILAVALVAALVAMPITSVISLSPLANIFFASLPFLVAIAASIILTTQHYKIGVLWVTLFIVHVIGAGLLSVLNESLAIQMNISAVIILSLLFGVVILFFCTLAEERPQKRHVVQYNAKKIPEYVASIAKNVKRINFAIGHVYRTSNGGSSALRTKIRMPKEWYEQLGNVEDLKVLLRKIHDRLERLAKKEKDIFSVAELQQLKRDGTDTVLAVLNKKERIKPNYNAAHDLCERLLHELQ